MARTLFCPNTVNPINFKKIQVEYANRIMLEFRDINPTQNTESKAIHNSLYLGFTNRASFFFFQYTNIFKMKTCFWLKILFRVFTCSRNASRCTFSCLESICFRAPNKQVLIKKAYYMANQKVVYNSFKVELLLSRKMFYLLAIVM